MLNKKICIIVLVGLPASNKTTFARPFVPFVNAQVDLSCVHVFYDDLVSRERQAKLAKDELAGTDTSQWKDTRRQIVAAVRDLVKVKKKKMLLVKLPNSRST